MTHEYIGIETLIGEYKTLVKQIEMLESRKEHLREQILGATGGEYEGYGLVITKQEPEPSLDWKTAIRVLEIDSIKLAPFYKSRPSYYRFTLKRGIEL